MRDKKCEMRDKNARFEIKKIRDARYLGSRIFYLASRIFLSRIYPKKIFFRLQLTRIWHVPYRLPYISATEDQTATLQAT